VPDAPPYAFICLSCFRCWASQTAFSVCPSCMEVASGPSGCTPCQAKENALAKQREEIEQLKLELSVERGARNDLHTTLWARIDETREKLRVEELKRAQAQEELAMCKQAREKLREELVKQQANNHQRNLELDALHLVWCSGGCADGVHRFGGSPEDVTLEVVKAVERQAQRLRQWYENAHARDDFYTKDCEHCGHDVASHGFPFKGTSQHSECDKCSCAGYVAE